MRNRQHLAHFAMCALLWLTGQAESADFTSASSHWAFQRLVPQQVPTVSNSALVRNPVDAFVVARLEAAGLRPSPAAPSPALLRRLSFDLTGLPPSAEQVQRPAGDIERRVDQLMASPQFGERWGRWWLDAVGYVDVLSLDNDPDILKVAPDKWRYRDYVVDAFNADLPFNRFLLEQLAGDELVDWRGAGQLTGEMRRLLTATGFLRSAPDDTDLDELNTPDVFQTLLQDTVENLGGNLLGLTLHCARCHDHKYEPLTQRDYFSFTAHFAPAFNRTAWLRPKDRAITDLPKPEQAEHTRKLAVLDAEVSSLKQAQQAIRDRYRDQLLEARLPLVPAEFRTAGQTAARTPFEKRTEEQRRLVGRFERLLRVTTDEIRSALAPADKAEWERIDKAVAAAEARRPVPPQIHAVFDTGQPHPVHVLHRGELDKPTELVQAALPTVLSGHRIRPAPEQKPNAADRNAPASTNNNHSPRAVGPTSGRRLALAQQLTAPNSPAAALMARVLMNRVWQQLFGRGLVESAANLGVSGARPSHPELLDWLAGEFIRNGWRLKPVIRLIITSHTYQQSSSSVVTGSGPQVDPSNALLWRQRPRRLESEMVRDSLLAVSGQLDLTRGGPPVLTEVRSDGSIGIAEKKLARPADALRRTLYLLQRRTYHLSLLTTFDQPLLNGNCLHRAAPATVGQSLTLLNDAFVLEQAAQFAAAVCAARPATAQRIELAFLTALGRPPAAEEVRWSQATVDREGVRRLLAGTAIETAREQAMAQLCHTLLNTSEFLSIP